MPSTVAAPHQPHPTQIGRDGSHKSRGGRLVPPSAPAPSLRPSAPRDRRSSARLLRTALQPGQTLGSAEITHPFHPLRGQRFAVLMIRKVSGAERLSLRHAEGSFAVRRDWTDWAPPGSPTEAANNNPPLLIDASGLLALSEVVLSLNRGKIRA